MATRKRTTILLIEDSPSDTRLIKESLREAPHERFTVLTASTLAKGLHTLERDTVDAILLDLSLPDSDGIDTFHTVRNLKPSLPIVVLTTTDDDVLGVQMVHEGAQDYLPKTVLTQETCTAALTRAIRYAIERKRGDEQMEALNERLYIANQELYALNEELRHGVRERTEELDVADEELRVTNEELRHEIEHRTNAEREAQAHARRQDILTHIISAGNKASDLQTACAAMLDTALDLLPFDFGAIFLREGDAVTLQHSRGYTDEQHAYSQRTPLTQSLVPRVMEGTPLFIDDYQAVIPRVVKEVNKGVASVTLIPLVSSGEVIGYYGAGIRDHQHHFTDEEQELLVSIGRQAGIVVARLQAERAIRTQAQHTALLNNIIRRGNTTTDAQDFLQYVCDLLVKAYGYDAVDMRIITDKGDIGEQVAVTGYPAEFNTQFQFMSIDDPILRGVYHGEPYFPARYTKTHVDLVHATHMASHGIVPLAVGETIIGDMGVALKDYRPFSPDEQALLISVGREAGTVLARLQAEEAAMQRAAMLDGVHDAVIMRDVNDHIIYWNDGAERLYGWTRQEALGSVIHDLLKTTFPEPFDQIRSALLETGRWGGELIHKTKAGAIITVESHKTLQRAPDGTPAATLEINTDITKLKRYADHLEDLVEERTAQLKEAERLAAIGQTATMIGHDLRNPLQAMQLLVDLAQKFYNDLTPEARAGFDVATADRIFSSVEKQIQYMDKIVSDLQDYARPLTLEREEVPLAAFISDSLALLTIPDVITVNVSAIDSITATIDPHLMQRALSNLIMNAVQAMPQGGKLTIGAAAEDHAVVIRIHDTGEGVPDNVKDTLFSPLTTGKAKGTGLGLAVVKRIVEAHNGTIEFESGEGEGTTFIVTLPQTNG